MVVERGVSFRYTLQLVVEVDHNLAKRHIECHLHAVARYVFLLDQFSALAEAERHYRPDKVGGGDYRSTDIRFLDIIDKRRFGQAGGIVHLGHGTFLVVDAIAYVRHRGDYIHIEFTSEAFLYYLHVEQAEEAAAETEAECRRGFRREGERGIVELKFFQ